MMIIGVILAALAVLILIVVVRGGMLERREGNEARTEACSLNGAEKAVKTRFFL